MFELKIRILPNYGKRYQTQFESVYPKAAADSDVTLIPFMLKNIALEKKLMDKETCKNNDTCNSMKGVPDICVFKFGSGIIIQFSEYRCS